MRILLTGGAGYIGSHTAIALCAAGHEVVCFDNLSNSRADVMDRLATIIGQAVPLVIGDIRDRHALEHAIAGHGIDAVIHFAGLKAVGEAVANPLLYYDNNVRGTLSLIEAMIACNVKKLVFSSSATVYGQPQYLPLDESLRWTRLFGQFGGEAKLIPGFYHAASRSVSVAGACPGNGRFSFAR